MSSRGCWQAPADRFESVLSWKILCRTTGIGEAAFYARGKKPARLCLRRRDGRLVLREGVQLRFDVLAAEGEA